MRVGKSRIFNRLAVTKRRIHTYVHNIDMIIMNLRQIGEQLRARLRHYVPWNSVTPGCGKILMYVRIYINYYWICFDFIVVPYLLVLPLCMRCTLDFLRGK